jgi:ParB/RepB/Spo0J family partition protein
MTPTTGTTFAHVPLAHIVASLTNPRRHFDQAKLVELAESIRAAGVHTPVLLRPLPGARVPETATLVPRPQFELVSGERRFRASGLAGMTDIPATIRALTDAEVLDIQLVENLQREDLSPLEEAEGYDRLMHAHEPALTAEQIGQRIGKSRSYVYGRLKLMNLGPEGRQALQDGWLEPSTALLVARMPSHKMQADALGNLKDWQGRVLSHRDASGMIERQYMLKLGEAKFKITDATLVPSAGSCRECPKRTGADPDLFADVKGADVCTDPACFKGKEHAHQERALKTARESGAQIIEGREAKELIQHSWTYRVEGYLRLDDKDDAPGRDKTLRQLIGKQMEKSGITPTLVANPHKAGELVAVITHDQASQLLAAKGYDDKAAAIEAKAQESVKAAEEAQKSKDRHRFETAWRMELLRTTWDKIDADTDYMVPESVVTRVATGLIPNQDGCKELCKLLELGKVAPAEAVRDWVQNHSEPHKALALMLMYQDREWQAWKKDEHNVTLIALATDAHGDSGVVHNTMDRVKKQHAADIKARNKVQADKAAADPAKASPPLAPAAQQTGGRGKGAKGKKPPAAPAPRLSAGDALQGIAAAMQGNEAGGDSAPGGADPAAGDADGGGDGRATAPDAGAAPLVPGARVRFVGVHMTGQLGRVISEATFGTGKWLLNVDGLSSEYVFEPHEFEVVADEQEAAA